MDDGQVVDVAVSGRRDVDSPGWGVRVDRRSVEGGLMRFDGTLTSWHDDRGFGFIEPVLGGDPVFVHIKAFDVRSGRPTVGQRVSFEVETGPQGRKRAKAVTPLRRTAPRRRITAKGAGRIDGRPFCAIGAFVLLYAAVTATWRVPARVGAFYAVLSVVCALAYLIDKSAAEHQRRRISEAALIGLGLAGGWPGAIVAQQVLRHKTAKRSFQSSFWFSVVVNMLVFAGLFAGGSKLPHWLAR